MLTIIFGIVVTLGLFILIALIFRNRGGQGNHNNSHPGYFSTYDGGHDGLGERGGDLGGREGSHDGGSYDGGWGDSGSEGDSGGGDGGGGDGGGGGE